MRDLKINIGGPKDQAKQDVNFRIHEQAAANAGEDLASILEQFEKEILDTIGDTKKRERAAKALTTLKAAKVEPKPTDDVISAVETLTGIIGTAGKVAAGTIALFDKVRSVFGI